MTYTAGSSGEQTDRLYVSTDGDMYVYLVMFDDDVLLKLNLENCDVMYSVMQ